MKSPFRKRYTWIAGVSLAGMVIMHWAAMHLNESVAMIGMAVMFGGFVFLKRTNRERRIYNDQLIRERARADYRMSMVRR